MRGDKHCMRTMGKTCRSNGTRSRRSTDHEVGAEGQSGPIVDQENCGSRRTKFMEDEWIDYEHLICT